MLRTLQDWFKDRWNNLDIFDETFVKEAESNPFYTVGGLFYFTWLIVIVTGVYLMLYYVPTTDQAFASVLRIQNEIPLGWIFRGFHKYGADAMIILATIRVYRMIVTGEYKRPRELTALFGILALVLCMYSGLTGYLLIWNQRAFWATKVFATFPTYLDQVPKFIPGADLINNLNIGKTTAQVLLGGTAIGQATITRFYSFHFAFSAIFLILIEYRFWRLGIAAKRMNLKGHGYLIIVLLLLTVAILLPAQLGRPSDPEQTPLPIFSDWYFLALYQMMKLQHPFLATVVTMGIPVFAISVILFDQRKEKLWYQRPVPTMVSLAGFINYVVFSFMIILGIADIKRDPPLWYLGWIVFLFIGYFWDWMYVSKRDHIKNRWSLYHPLVLLFLIGAELANTAWFYLWGTPWWGILLALGLLVMAASIGIGVLKAIVGRFRSRENLVTA